MNSFYEEVKSKAFSAFRALSREYAPFEDASMLVGSADSKVSLTRSKITKTIDTEWIEKIEAAIGAIDVIVRNPSVAIEDVDEILPVELSKHITDKSIKHLAQHTNLILDVRGDEIVPQKILNVFHEETSLTYENKFVNTLLSRLSAFVDKRMRALGSASGIEMDYRFDYSTEFEHLGSDDGGRNSARINLRIELTSPLGREMSESDLEVNERYIEALNRIKRINMALISYRSSAFSQKLGKNYVRPPVIRTNAILKNKNLRECLNLWEYIESYDKVGYSFIGDKYYELPSADFVGGMYSSVALQYLTLYSGIAGELENNRLVSEKHLFETFPEFDDEIENEELDDYQVYDSEYKKTVPVSRLMNNRKKLSEDEKKVRQAILVALKADEIINEELLREEAEKRRLAREKRLAEEAEAKRLAEEAEARRLAEEEAARLAAEAAKREVEVRYRRSFLSRFIQAESHLQDYYNEIKNELLSYQGVKSRIAWAKESFKRGRTHIAKIDVKGKALYLYLALDPATLEGTKYRVSVAKGDCPTLIKIKNERKKKYALELIAMLMESLAIARIEREAEDFRMPYEETEALIERGLIKVILPKGEALDENSVAVKADLSELEAMHKEHEDGEVAGNITETDENEAEVVEEAEEILENEENESENEEIEPETEATEVTEEAEAEMREVEVRYRRSFLSRYIQAEPYIQDYYTEIKNELLSYQGVKARSAWAKESFKRGRTHIAKIDVKGKALYLYLALDPTTLEGTKYRVSTAKGDCPTLIKIKTERKKKYALELIAMLMESLAITRIEREAEDFRMPYEETEALIERGLIKVILPKGEALDENSVAVKADLSELEAMHKEHEDGEVAENITETDENEAEVVEEVEEETENGTEVVVETVQTPETEEEVVTETAQTPETEEIVENATEEIAKEEPEAEAVEESSIDSEPLDESGAEAITEATAPVTAIETEEATEQKKAISEDDEELADQITAIESDASFDAVIDRIIDMASDEKAIESSVSKNKSSVYRGSRSNADRVGFAYKDSADGNDAVVIPYTREEYLSLPRKKKKSVLMNVKHLLRYAAIKRIYGALCSVDNGSDRSAYRIAMLKRRLDTQRKSLPSANLWADAVKRVIK